MSTAKNLLAGLGGAIALNILHESLKKLGPNMPRIDLLGEEALQKSLHTVDAEITDEDTLYGATLGADLISNALYFSLIGAGNPKHIWPKAIALGLAAGSGAIALPESMGLNPKPVTRSPKTKALTVAYYLTGALVTGFLLKATSKKR